MPYRAEVRMVLTLERWKSPLGVTHRLVYDAMDDEIRIEVQSIDSYVPCFFCDECLVVFGEDTEICQLQGA
ncbi:MAG: hypothetical protein EBU49_00280 [Proteobacteria bacterium]|nr:hypothetical protein [Pseudomonadota bacterium]